MKVKQNIITKPWGYELVLAHTDKYVGKILFIEKGHRLSKQYHEIKDETLYVLEGVLTLLTNDADGNGAEFDDSPNFSLPFTKYISLALIQ